MAKITLKTNIALVGVAKYLDAYAGKVKDGEQLAPDLGLKGTWEGEGEGTVYLPIALLDTLVREGYASYEGTDAAGTPQKVKWLYKGRVEILRAEEGRKKVTTVRGLDGPPAPAAPPPAESAPAPSAEPLSAEEILERTRAYWIRQYRLMEFSLAQAYAVHKKVAPESALDHAVVASTAHSFFIQANRDGAIALPRAANGESHAS